MKKQIDVPLLFSLWHSDIENRELAERIGVSNSSLWEIRKRYGLPPRKREHKDREVDDPTPEEIEERSAECRAKWTVSEEKLRRVGKQEAWKPPTCAIQY